MLTTHTPPSDHARWFYVCLITCDASPAAVECKKLLADRSRPTTSGSETRQKLQVLATLAGDKAAADQLLRDAPHMFPTIEDFMWFRIAVIRTQPQHLEPSGQMPYSLTGLLSDLQLLKSVKMISQPQNKRKQTLSQRTCSDGRLLLMKVCSFVYLQICRSTFASIPPPITVKTARSRCCMPWCCS